jgi:hypothetical protein
MAIDNAPRNVGFQRIVNYLYITGHCLFDSISYLLHGYVFPSSWIDSNVSRVLAKVAYVVMSACG